MNQDDVTFQAINKLTKILAARIREHANAAMYPTSSNSLHYKAKWNDFLGDIEAPEDVEQGEWKAYKDIYFKDKDTERALENLSNSVMPPIEQAKYIVRSLHQDDSPLFPNAVATIANVYKHAKKVRSSIEEFEFGDAENHLTQLDKYVEKLNPTKLKTTQSPEPEPSSPLLSECFDNFIKDKSTGVKKWTDSMLKDNRRGADTLLALIGDRPITAVDGQVLDEALELAFNMPLRNRKPYKNMSISECVELARKCEVTEDNVISPKTVLGYKKLLQGLYVHLKFKRIVKITPTDDMLLKISSSTRRGAFSIPQVRNIIEYANKTTELYQKWPLLLMTYTGMRNGEIMQLRKQDISKDAESKIFYLHISHEAGSVKTKAANRRIPVHSELINAGFLKFVDSSKDGELFVKDSKYLSRLYQIIKRELDLPCSDEKGDVLNLYSIRHSVITSLQSNDVNTAITQQLVGHSKQGSITDRYTHNIDLVSLRNAIELIRY